MQQNSLVRRSSLVFIPAPLSSGTRDPGHEFDGNIADPFIQKTMGHFRIQNFITKPCQDTILLLGTEWFRWQYFINFQ